MYFQTTDYSSSPCLCWSEKKEISITASSEPTGTAGRTAGRARTEHSSGQGTAATATAFLSSGLSQVSPLCNSVAVVMCCLTVAVSVFPLSVSLRGDPVAVCPKIIKSRRGIKEKENGYVPCLLSPLSSPLRLSPHSSLALSLSLLTPLSPLSSLLSDSAKRTC
jgi:hypothetical protein